MVNKFARFRKISRLRGRLGKKKNPGAVRNGVGDLGGPASP